MPEALLLEVSALTCGHGDAMVLSDVSFSLAPGRSLALLGRNGTGKTTLIDTLVGVTRRFAGRIEVHRDLAAPRRRILLERVRDPAVQLPHTIAGDRIDEHLGDLVQHVPDSAGAVDLDRGRRDRDGDLVDVTQDRTDDRSVVFGLGQVDDHEGVGAGVVSKASAGVPDGQADDLEGEALDLVGPGERGLGWVGVDQEDVEPEGVQVGGDQHGGGGLSGAGLGVGVGD